VRNGHLWKRYIHTSDRDARIQPQREVAGARIIFRMGTLVPGISKFLLHVFVTGMRVESEGGRYSSEGPRCDLCDLASLLSGLDMEHLALITVMVNIPLVDIVRVDAA
jgi:hypothetical protein